jgi:hypothetical protein
MATLPEKLEAAHRRQLVVDSKRAAALGKELHQFRVERSAAIKKWTHTIRTMMEEHGASDPVEILPAIAASLLEHAVVEARETAETTARAEIQRLLRKAVVP